MTGGTLSEGRVPLIAGNWKMYKTSREGAAFIRRLADVLGPLTEREVLVAPPFTGLFEAVAAAEGSCISVSAQDVFWEAEGAYTGEVAAGMLADLGVRAVIVGHSERRQQFGETDDAVARKVRAALEGGLRPIMCVGETGPQREAAQTEAVLSTQVTAGLAFVAPEEARCLAIAYEPVWAIGTGKTATPEQAEDAIAFVRTEVSRALGVEAATATRILYGGSVRPDNIDALMERAGVDGVLAGGASLDIDSFTRIVMFERG